MSMGGSGNAAQWAAQGQQAMQAGMYEQAAQSFYQAIQLAPTVDGLYYHYASACLWRGFVQDAVGALDRCMALGGQWYNHAMQMQMQIRSQMQMQQQMPMMGMPGQGMPMQAMQGQMPMGGMPMPGQMPGMGQMPMQQQMPGQMMGAMPQLGAMPMPGQMPMTPMGGHPSMAGALGGMQMGAAPAGGGIQALVGQQQAAPEKEPEKKKKKGVGWGLAAFGIIGAAALGTAIGTGALDGVTKKVLG